MSFSQKFRLGLAAKLAICVIASTTAFFALFGYINLRSERRQAEELVEMSALRIADVIARGTRDEMLKDDPAALHSRIDELGSEPGIHAIRLFNKEGRITYSTLPAEIGRKVDQKAEQCVMCHAKEKPLETINPSQRARRFPDEQGRPVLGVMRPIENAPACSNADCHVHHSGRQVLGVIDADMSLDKVEAQIHEHQVHLTWFLIGAIVFGCTTAVSFMWFVVYRPVKSLIAGTHRVAGGDLEYRLPVHSDDELGDLAASFNRMTEEVGGVQAKIEEQVHRKTAELEKVYKTLLRSEKMASIGKLAATVAHEINNPLFGILTYARLISRDVAKLNVPGRDEMAEQLQTIERESKRCGDLVKNLLTFSRQAPSVREPNDLNTIVHRAVLLIRHKVEMQTIELNEQLAKDLPPVQCDANQIQQVILVLLVNASEAMSKGGTLEVTTTFDPQSEQGVVRVKDTGCGIPPDVLSRIFDPFFTTKEDQNRTGLGLAVAHSILEQHGGEITVLSEPGVGTEFQVALPVAVLAEARA